MSTFYLSGGMEYKTNLGSKWRDWLTRGLHELGHTVVDPVKMEMSESGQPFQHMLTAWKEAGELGRVREVTRQSLFVRDIRGLYQSDAMVLFYDESVQRGAGSLSESWEAFRVGKPVYLVTEFPITKVPTWLIGETTEIFPSFELFLEYVTNHNRVVCDMSAAQKSCDTMLAEVHKGL